MGRVAVYNTNTGEIYQTYDLPDGDESIVDINDSEVQWAGLPVDKITGFDSDVRDDTHKVNLSNGTIEERPPLTDVISTSGTKIRNDGKSSFEITGLPVSSTVRLNSPLANGADYTEVQDFNVLDGTFSLTATTLGVFRVQIYSFPYRSETYEVEALSKLEDDLECAFESNTSMSADITNDLKLLSTLRIDSEVQADLTVT